jgi:hypothetical protein
MKMNIRINDLLWRRLHKHKETYNTILKNIIDVTKNSRWSQTNLSFHCRRIAMAYILLHDFHLSFIFIPWQPIRSILQSIPPFYERTKTSKLTVMLLGRASIQVVSSKAWYLASEDDFETVDCFSERHLTILNIILVTWSNLSCPFHNFCSNSFLVKKYWLWIMLKIKKCYAEKMTK